MCMRLPSPAVGRDRVCSHRTALHAETGYAAIVPQYMKRFVKCILELLMQKGGEMAKWQGIWVLPLGFCQFTFLGRDTMLCRYALR